jgi:hypothetical protein
MKANSTLRKYYKSHSFRNTTNIFGPINAVKAHQLTSENDLKNELERKTYFFKAAKATYFFQWIEQIYLPPTFKKVSTIHQNSHQPMNSN